MELLRQELEEFSVDVRDDSVLSNLLRVGQRYNLGTTQLVNEWVSFSTNSRKECPLDDCNVEKFNSQLQIRQSKHTPTSRRAVPRTGRQKVYTKDNLSELFGVDVPGTAKENDDENIDLMNTYAGVTPDRSMSKGKKRVNTSPITPVSKVAHSTQKTPSSNYQLEDQSPSNRYVSETPSGKYSNRGNKGNIVCEYNSNVVIDKSTLKRPAITIFGDSPLTATPKHMYQKPLERAAVLKDRLEEFGESICKRNSLDQSDSAATPTYVGIIACDGEGRLNINSCLLEGVASSWKTGQTRSVQLVIPDGLHSCSLFPGQVVAVQGQLYDDTNTLIASRIFDEGCPPSPSLDRGAASPVGGFTMMMASGPFTTSDSLDMTPLHDLLGVVSRESPSVLLLMGPFLDITHDEVKDWSRAETFESFLLTDVFGPIVRTCRKSNTQVVVVPSQKDIAHPWTVYPQPPFTLDKEASDLVSDVVTFVSDPAIISINGMYVGVSSTDILFHLNSLAMFVGPNPDRMAKLTSHVIHQQSFYPLYPPYCRVEQDTPSDHAPYLEHTSDVNLDLQLAYDKGHAILPIMPDMLVLTSDLKPFVKTIDGCLCVNTGHLTKKAGGGIYSTVTIEETVTMDLPANTRIQIAYI